MFSSILISPQYFEYIGLLGFGIPVIMLANLIMGLFMWAISSKSKWVFLVLIILAWPFYGAIYQVNFEDTSNKEGLKVLSYNVKWFVEARKDKYDSVITWIRGQEADILCFQEFYPLKGIQDKIGKGSYVSSDEKEFHTAIFSKYPIINDGLLFEKSALNNIRFVDIKIDEDTIRVYNVHLQSMGINPEKLSNESGIQNEFEDIGYRFTSASQIRSSQMAQLSKHVENCDYPVILAGDFNDIPFSFNYMKMRRSMANAFEEKGKGFGVTFNNNIPFLRIDNQFCSEEFEVKSFQTLNDVFFSDHFPLVGIYQLTP